MFRFRAGYYSTILSGILTPISIALIVKAIARFPPAESPVRMIFWRLIFKYIGAKCIIHKYTYQQSSKPSGNGFSGANL